MTFLLRLPLLLTFRKSHACCGCSLVNALMTPPQRFTNFFKRVTEGSIPTQ